MDEALLSTVFERIESDRIADAVGDLVLAACLGDDSLAAALGGQATPRPEVVAAESAEPAGAFLTSIVVEGFRGIGAPATLTLRPGAGLTVVVGRNGSGKSSFAEGVEVLFTGSADRLASSQSQVFRDGWRNLHTSSGTKVRAELVVEGVGGTTGVERVWAPDTPFDKGVCTAQLAGGKKGSLEQLGWGTALVEYRPFLAHGELGAMFAKPSDLHDRLSEVLGLDELSVAQKRLADHRKRHEDAASAVNKSAAALLADLTLLDDDRATACAAIVKPKGATDLAALRAALVGESLASTTGPLLDQLARLDVVGLDAAAATVADVRAASLGLREVHGTDGDRARRTAALLRAALDHHDREHDGPCPVCGVGMLDDAWRGATETLVRELDESASAAEAATRVATEALGQAQAVVKPMPSCVGAAAQVGLDGRVVAAAWAQWSLSPAPSSLSPELLDAWAAHLEDHAPALADAAEALRAQALAQRNDRDARWLPLAARLQTWSADAQRVQAVAFSPKDIKAAEGWLKDAIGDLRNQRLAPIARRAQEIWDQLRHESDITLEGIELTGSSTRRAVDIRVTIEGVSGAALGVMSQGEVNALALSVFLPRATLPASPFRFLVIDDPVQAMDPAKVDGLATVLAEVARTRQVIVFTHDDRLTASIRRMRIAARVVSVRRSTGSAVEVVDVDTPALQSLSDAYALTKDDNVPADVKARVVPVLCRGALEATLADRYRALQLASGVKHEQVEGALTHAETLTKLAALALVGDVSRGGEVLPKIKRLGNRYADAYQAMNKGAHGAYTGDLGLLVRDTGDLIKQKDVCA